MSNKYPFIAELIFSVLLTHPAVAGVVFSEIMYNPVDNPDGSTGDPYEYIELYNNGPSPEILTGATFTKGITYSFTNAPSTVLNPGEYLVVVLNYDAFHSRYPDVTNVAAGEFTGKLSNDGEKVTLKIVDTSVSVTYGVKGAWPAAANAFGPSLERYCMEASGDNSANWAASGMPTDWQQVAWTGQFDSASIPISFFLDFDGKCLLDDVSVKAVGSDEELVENGTFESGLTGWSVTNNHSQSRIEDGLGRGGSAALAIQCNESRWYVDKPVYSVTFYGDGASNRIVSAPTPVVTGQEYAVSWWVRRTGLASYDGIAGKIYSVIGGATNSLTLGSLGTPGRANTVSTSFLPIGITNVIQAYTLCPTGMENVVRARVTVPAEVSDVTARFQVIGTNEYRYTSGSYSNLTMRDDGVAPDTVAGDGEYAVALPAVTSNWKLVRYHVIATATNGFQAQSPQRDDPGADYAYWVQASSPQTNLPNWHVLVDGNPVIYPVSRHLCAVSPEGQIFTEIMAKHRGSPDDLHPQNTGIGLHFHRSNRYNGWFAGNLKAINIRYRLNNVKFNYQRLVAEPLAYDLQRLIGLPTPRWRFICAWINGFPTITTELENPDEPYLTGNGLSLSDFVTRQSYSDGLEYVGGDVALDNFDSVNYGLNRLNGTNRNAFIRTNLCYESVQHCLALLAVTGNGDQDFVWNMFQHRAASDGRWRQYPWDVDMSFNISYTNAGGTLMSLHPYYQTPLHPNIWTGTSYSPLGLSLFYPEADDATTLPYRYRQQTTLWRYCATLFTTNVLFPKLAAIQSTLEPAFRQISAYRAPSVTLASLSNQVNGVKDFIVQRRDFLMNGDWSDKMTDLWNPANSYTPSNVVITEIMHAPLSGGKYIELYNRGQQAIDLSHWSLSAGSFSAPLPFGAMLAPTSFVVLAASQSALTNTYAELGDPAKMILRYINTGIWDWPLTFASASEYASRVIEVAGLGLPAYSGTLELRDMISNLIDRVAYNNIPPWPDGNGVSLERIDPNSTNTSAEAWRACTVIGTPGWLNTATADVDLDGLPDAWEQQIIAASDGAFTNISQVLAGDDFDNDGLNNGNEFGLGTNPLIPDSEAAVLLISIVDGCVYVGFPTIPLAGNPYAIYKGRFYTLLSTTNLAAAGWSAVPGYSGLPAGGPIIFTNAVLQPVEAFRFEAELRPIRP